MNILYVSQYFPPEVCAPAARVSELAKHWVKNGHEVTVLTAFPNHPTGVIHTDYRKRFWRLHHREKWSDVRVMRTWLLPLANADIWRRVICYVSFCISACIAGLFVKRPDVVIATSPQLLAGLSGWFLSCFFRVPFLLEVRDLWPESLCAVGARSCRTRFYRAVGWLARFLYHHSEHIVVVTQAFRDELVACWRVDSSKISVVENGVETELFSPSGPTDIRHPFGLEGKFIASYIGTVGMAHGLGTLLEAAESIRADCPGAHVLVIGDGAEQARLRKEATARRLSNLSFIPAQPRDSVPAFIRASDVCVVPLRKADAFRKVIPTKMLEFMSCGRAVVLGVEGQAAEILQEAKAGICVEPESAVQLAAAIRQLYRDSELRGRMGANGRAYILQRMTRERMARKYEIVLRSVLHDKDLGLGLRAQPATVPRSDRM